MTPPVPPPGALLLLRAAARVLAREHQPHHQLGAGGGGAAPSLLLLRALAAPVETPAGPASFIARDYSSLATRSSAAPRASTAAPQQQQHHQQHRRSLASDAAAAASTAAAAERPKQQRRPLRPNNKGGGRDVDRDLLRGLPFFRGGGGSKNNPRRGGPPNQQQHQAGGGSSGRRPAPPPPTEQQRALRACATAQQLREHLSTPGVIERLTVPELVSAAMRASDLRATDLLLMPPTAAGDKAGGAAAGSPPPPPPPLAARLLELVPQMDPVQLARTFYSFSWRAPSPDRVPGLHDVLLPPLREAARLLAEGAPFGRYEPPSPPPAAAAAAAEETGDPQQQQQDADGSVQPDAQHPPTTTTTTKRGPLTPYSACIVALGLGRLQLRDEPAAAHIAAATAERLAPQLAGSQSYLLASLAQGLSTAGRHQWSAFAAIAEAARPAVRGQLSPGSLATLARAMATARHADEPMYDAICRASTPLLMADAITYASMPPLPPALGAAGVAPEPWVAEAAQAAAAKAADEAEDNEAPDEDGLAAAEEDSNPPPSNPSTPSTFKPRFKTTQLAQLLWALATIHHPLRPEFFAAVAAAGAAMAPRMGALEVVEVAWACARRRAYAPSLYSALARRSAELADAGAIYPRQATLVAWSVARQGHSDARLLSALARLVIRSGVGSDNPPAAASMMPFNLSNMAWAYGALGVVAEGEGQQAAGGGAGGDGSASSSSGGGGGGGGLSSGPLVVPELPELIRCLARAALKGRFEDFKPQNLSDLAFGLSACGYGRGAFSSSGGKGGGANGTGTGEEEELEEARQLYSRLADAAVAQAAQLTNHSLADLCWAFAHAGAPAPQLFAHATAAAAQPGRLSGFSLGMAADLLWASAAAGHRDDALLDAAAELLPHRIEQLARDPEAASKIRWALGRQPHAPLAAALAECEGKVAAAAAEEEA